MSGSRIDIQPELWARDGPAAVAFYERAFGAVVEHQVSGPGELAVVAQLAVGDARFWVSTASEDLHRFSPDSIGRCHRSRYSKGGRTVQAWRRAFRSDSLAA